jgi:hypothetical protein
MEVCIYDRDIRKSVLKTLLQVGAHGFVEPRQVDLDRRPCSCAPGDDRVQHCANLDLCVLAGVDGAIDQKSHVRANDLGHDELERLAIAADRAPRTDAPGFPRLILLVQLPEVRRKHCSVVSRQRQEIVDECIAAILVQECDVFVG